MILRNVQYQARPWWAPCFQLGPNSTPDNVVVLSPKGIPSHRHSYNLFSWLQLAQTASLTQLLLLSLCHLPTLVLLSPKKMRLGQFLATQGELWGWLPLADLQQGLGSKSSHLRLRSHLCHIHPSICQLCAPGPSLMEPSVGMSVIHANMMIQSWPEVTQAKARSSPPWK